MSNRLGSVVELEGRRGKVGYSLHQERKEKVTLKNDDKTKSVLYRCLSQNQRGAGAVSRSEDSPRSGEHDGVCDGEQGCVGDAVGVKVSPLMSNRSRRDRRA